MYLRFPPNPGIVSIAIAQHVCRYSTPLLSYVTWTHLLTSALGLVLTRDMEHNNGKTIKNGIAKDINSVGCVVLLRQMRNVHCALTLEDGV